MKKYLLIKLLCFATVFASAQEMDGFLSTGLIASQLDGDQDGGYNKVSFYGGFGLEIPLKEKTDFRFEILYARKGSRNGPRNPNIFTFRLNYLDFPAVVQYKLLDHISGGLGLNLGYLLNAQLSNGFGFQDQTFNFQRTDLGGILYLAYDVNDDFAIELRYNRGLNSSSRSLLLFNNAVFFGVAAKL